MERAIVRAVQPDNTDVDVDQIVKDLQVKVWLVWLGTCPDVSSQRPFESRCDSAL